MTSAFINGTCHRCHDSYQKFGAPKSCEQCKQNCAFDKKDKNEKAICWLCFMSAKRALARTKQPGPSKEVEKQKELSGKTGMFVTEVTPMSVVAVPEQRRLAQKKKDMYVSF